MTKINFYKLQIKDDTRDINRVDEVLTDNRVTSNLDYSGKAFNNLTKGDIVLVHKGNAAEALVEIVYKISDETEINGTSFGVDYKIKILNYYKDSAKFPYHSIGENKIGFSNTFSQLHDKKKNTYKFIESWYNSLNPKFSMHNTTSILKHKKQIILQGPPGTGKTRLAKQIAEEICKPKTNSATQVFLSNDYISGKLENTSSIKSAKQKTSYKITNVKEDRCTVVLENDSSYEIPFKGIIQAYNTKLWLGGQSNGFDPYNAAVAKYLYDTKELKPIDEINNFFKNFKTTHAVIVNRNTIKIKNEEFISKFPADTIINLSKERYAVGHEDLDGFCYWLEYKLTETGKYTGTAINRKLYWSSDQDKYIKSGFIKNIEDDDLAMQKMGQLLHDIIYEKDPKGDYKIGNGFVLKTLNTYKPNIYFPINNEAMLNNALKLIGFNGSSMNYLEKNKKLQSLFLELKNKYNSDVENHEFMYFLFKNFNNLKGEFNINKSLVFKGSYKLIQFHPSYTYEDFVRGITVKTNSDNKIYYKVENKVLIEMAIKAMENPKSNYVLIIDEINRANLSSVLGELIYALEYRYYFKKDNFEESSVESVYDKSKDELIPDRKITLPENFFIIGTINTADRSVGQIDYAIRRRFAFVDVLPKVLSETDLNADRKENEPQLYFKEDVFLKVKELFLNNEGINSEHLSDEFKAKDVQLGHSYFIYTEDNFKYNLDYEIKPILKEYVTDGILKSSALPHIEAL